ncbi:unnamed protein product [Spirodela intermedia]|uniref:Leucine-rich repeat-containing N-terminal plant-type domain-containing protein n=1 Tax=Spirodela intermedia TaxID=51605 RepID=A0A7I8JJW2_SPIIN|nr:unnamed protein product [Spirodela intermedia]CAA6670456.1 unnamed protein product [Spirodela intermedia]
MPAEAATAPPISRPWLVLVVVLLLNVGCPPSDGCLLRERTALLELRSSQESVKDGSYSKLLSSWTQGAGDCCSWPLVNCSDESGRVTRLHLANLGGDPDLANPWYLNFSVFSSFTELEHLDLSDNRIIGSMAAAISDLTSVKKLSVLDLSFNKLEGKVPCSIRFLNGLTKLDLSRNDLGDLPDCLGELRKLEILNLRYNNLRGGIQTFVGNLSNLHALDLTGNGLQVGMPYVLGHLKKLRILNLSGNQLDKGIPSFLGNMSSLRQLHLRHTSLTGEIPRFLGNLSELGLLDLGWNNLGGKIPEILGCLKKLASLKINDNSFEGAIPISLENMTSLRHLDMSENQLEGEIHPTVFYSLSSLEELRLDDNKLSGNFSFQYLVKCSRLRELSLSSNFMLKVQMNYGDPASNLQLSSLFLSFCDLSENLNLDESFFLKSQRYLTSIDLSCSGISGSLPTWLFENNINLQYVVLCNSSLKGEFPLLKTPSLKVMILDLCQNKIRGTLPENFSNTFPGLNFLIQRKIPLLPNQLDFAFLNIENNKLSGEIRGNLPRISYLGGNNFTSLSGSLSSIQNIEIFDVHDNQLSGEVPEFIWASKELSTLVLRGNKFHGEIPHGLCKLESLTVLDMSHNMFSGYIPQCSQLMRLNHLNLAVNNLSGKVHDKFTDFAQVEFLNLGGNSFTDNLEWTKGLRQIKILLLGQNNFYGEIPTHLCRLHYLHLLDLFHNNLSGVIPQCLDNTGLNRRPDLDIDLASNLHLWFHKIKGSFYNYIGNNLYLFVAMDLSSNHLEGQIPHSIGNLTSLKSLNLSFNHLTGLIPTTLSGLQSIESLDLSHNELEGSIPSELLQLSSLEIFSVAYNRLEGCTPPLKGQFHTFDRSSYEGNADLHGFPIDACRSKSNYLTLQHGHDDVDKDKSILYGILLASLLTFFLITCSYFLFSHSFD